MSHGPKNVRHNPFPNGTPMDETILDPGNRPPRAGTPPGPAPPGPVLEPAPGFVRAHARRGTRGVRAHVRWQLRELAEEFLDGEISLEEYLQLRPLILDEGPVEVPT